MSQFISQVDRGLSLTDAINLIHEYKANQDLADATRRDYKSYYKMLKFWATERDIQDVPLANFTEEMAIDYVFYLRSQPYKNITKNNHLYAMRHFFDFFKSELKIVKENHFESIKIQKVVNNLPLGFNQDTQKKILEHLKEHDIRLYYASLFLYYCFIRPNELRSLQIKDIDLKNRMIRLDRSVTKTGKDKFMRICDPLALILTDMQIGMYPVNYYLFGRLLNSSDTQLYRSDYFSKRWRRTVKNLDIPANNKFYHWKHTGIQDHLNTKGIPLLDICRQSGLTLEVLNTYAESTSVPASEKLVSLAPFQETEKRFYSMRKINKIVGQVYELSEAERIVLFEEIKKLDQ